MVTAITQIAIAFACCAGGLMSSSTACDIGISAAPHRPWSKPRKDDFRQRLRQPAQRRGDGESNHRKQEHALASDLPGQPAR